MHTYLIDGNVVLVPVRIVRTSAGWVVPAWAAPMFLSDALCAETVTGVRAAIAQAAWNQVKSGILPLAPAEVEAIRLLTTVATVHPRNTEAAGPIVQVQAVADRAEGGWTARVAGGRVLSNCTASGETFGEAAQALVSTVMLELEMAEAIASDWSGVEMQVATRKTYPVAGLA